MKNKEELDKMELLTTKETAAALKISVKTLYRLFSAEKLEHVKVGDQIRVPRHALDQYITAHTRGVRC